jgi:aminotransferase
MAGWNEALDQIHPSAIRSFSNLAKNTPGCIALTLGEPDIDTDPVIAGEIETALAHQETHYIPNAGTMDLRRAIAAFEKENGMDYRPEEVLVTDGATEGLFVSLFSLLNPGDEVIVPVPSFVLYEEICHLCRAEFVPYDTGKEHGQISYAKLKGLINEHTKAIVLNTPNNPTGCIMHEASLQAVYEAVKGTGIYVICDDVYQRFVYTENYHSFMEYRDLRDQLILVQSFSKPYAMTGWRMGYVCAPVALIAKMTLVHQYMVTSTPSLFQRACIQALHYDPSPFIERCRKRRDYVLARLDEMGLETDVPEGAFYVFPSIAGFHMCSEEFCLDLLKKEKLALTPGSAFHGEGHVRISYCAGEEMIQEGMDRLENYVKGKAQ